MPFSSHSSLLLLHTKRRRSLGDRPIVLFVAARLKFVSDVHGLQNSFTMTVAPEAVWQVWRPPYQYDEI